MEKLSKERKEELYGSLLLINIYCLEPQKNMSLDDYRKVLEEIKLKILKIRDRETEENTKELFKQLKPLKKLSLFYPEEECFISNKREVVNQFKDMISEDLFYLPYNFVKKNFKLPKVYSISHSSKYGIFEAISSIITPETEFMEDALISYLILKNEKEL